MQAEFAVTRTERGWAGHFCASDGCKFRRNTLLHYRELRVVVSTVGAYVSPSICGFPADDLKTGFSMIGCDRYFETMAFHAAWDGRYWDADVSRNYDFESEMAIGEPDADDKANDMHERIVTEISNKMLNERK